MLFPLKLMITLEVLSRKTSIFVYQEGMQACIYIAQTAQTIHPSGGFFDELRVVLHACCRNADAKGILRLADDNRPEDLSLYHSLTEKNNVILDYYEV